MQTPNYLTLVLTIFSVSLCQCTNTIYFCDKVRSNSIQIPKSLMRSKDSQQFRIETRNVVSCPTTTVTFNSSLSNPSFFFLSTGDIFVPDQDYFLRDDYCISRYEDDLIEIRHCEVNCNTTHVCLYKCCPPDQIYSPKTYSDFNSSCVTLKDGNFWRPIFYDDHKGCGVRTVDNLTFHLRPVPHGQRELLFFPYKHIHINNQRQLGARFRLMTDGHLEIQSSKNQWNSISQGEFCIDGLGMQDESKSNEIIYSGHFHEQLFFDLGSSVDGFEDYIEFNESEEAPEMDDYYPFEEFDTNLGLERFYITLFLIGAGFLFATSVLYLLIYDKHNIHGWTIFAYVTTMLFMFIFLGTAHILSISKNSDFGGTSACKSIGILVHFFYLSTMCWLTIINVDLWLTFRNVKPTNGRRQNFARFGLYSIFAIGCPLIIVAFAVILDALYIDGIGDGSECESPYILPIYGENNCYIQKDAYWPWLYYPIAILLSCNIITFSSTVFSLIMYRKTTRNAMKNNHHQKDSIILFGKLFVVAGISWVFELISNTGNTHWSIWIIFDCYNLLQAILIFIIFALKRENVIHLYHKYPLARGILGPMLKCCYSGSFDPERTDMTGVSFDRTSRFHFRKGSTTSMTAGLTSRLSTGSQNGVRKDSRTNIEDDNLRFS